MDRKQLLKKIAIYGTKRNMSMRRIIFLSVVIICYWYFKNFTSKIAACIFAPFKAVYGKIKGAFLYVIHSVKSFCKRHRFGILKLECGIAAVGIVLLVIYNKNTLDGIWGDENTGVFAEETKNDMEEEKTVEVLENKGNTPQEEETETKAEEKKEHNTVVEEEVPVNANLNKYYIELNRAMNTVTIYTYDNNGEYTIPVKAMRCATGGDNTPLGTYELSDRFVFATLLYDSYGQYCTRIDGPILFHSSTYTALKKDTLSAEDYNLLGESVSHGCIRLTVADAKWIFDNCAEGTVVTIYDGDDPGPLGKPETIHVPEGTLWDPTDPDPDNPWNDKKPVISGAQSKTVYEYDEYDILDGITAVDTCGNDITEDIVVEGEVDVDMPGVYNVTYTVTDLLGRQDSVMVTITVI